MCDTYSHKSILESLSAFLMPCTTIETCSMAGFSCGWLLQAPSEAYLPKRDVVLKPCQTISPGFTKGKAPVDILCYRRCYTSKGDHSVGTVIIRHPGKTNLLKIHHTLKTFQSVKHWEAQTPISKLKIPLEKGRLARTGGMTDPHIARRFTRMRVWLWNGST